MDVPSLLEAPVPKDSIESLTPGSPISKPFVQPEWVTTLASSYVDEDDLKLERSRSTIEPSGLTKFLLSAKVIERKRHILSILKADPVFDKSRNYYLGPVEKLEVANSRGRRLRQLSVEESWSGDDYQTAADLIGEPDPYGLHASLFLVNLRLQGSEEQHRTFVDKAESWEYIGCYAQTELGHGSNVRNLETTATWDREDNTFILHTPSLAASKWWIGSLGKAATHAMVMAQLIIAGKSYGPHSFMVQVRDLQSRDTLPNVHMGDVGPKFGYNTMDTGFLLLNRLRVPHGNMLSRYAYVNPQTDAYERRGSPSAVYATMTYVRSVIVQRAGAALARGVTIATRYCAVRRQFADHDRPKENELQVLDYTTVQMRLLPLLATTFALHFTGNAMIALHEAGSEPGASTKISDLHATSCGLKALATTLTADGLETCRRACGGQGYSSFSGIGSWYADYLPAVTWEGDNYMITQQVARHLLKAARLIVKGDYSKSDSTEILADFLKRREEHAPLDILGDQEQSDSIVRAFAWRAAYLTFAALKKVDEEKSSWNSMLVDFWRLSTAYSEYLIVKNFNTTLTSSTIEKDLDSETRSILRNLFNLFALTTLEQRALEFLSTKAIELSQIERITSDVIPSLMAQIRSYAVKLVDAWMFDDWQLDSSLGRHDGKVHEDLFRRASTNNPRNDVTFDHRLEGKL